MTAIVYELSMPGVASWNRRWSGQDRCHAIVKPVRPSKKHTEHCKRLVGSHFYDWCDGWRARVSVRIVDSAEARKIRRASKGFCGYEWMVDSIERFGEILDTKGQRGRLALAPTKGAAP